YSGAHRGWDDAQATEFPQAHRRNHAGLVCRHPDRLDTTGDRPESGPLARSWRRAEVPDAAADSPGDAPGGDAHYAGRQTRRLLRDLHEAVLRADPAGWHAGHDRVGLWGGHEVGDQP